MGLQQKQATYHNSLGYIYLPKQSGLKRLLFDTGERNIGWRCIDKRWLSLQLESKRKSVQLQLQLYGGNG